MDEEDIIDPQDFPEDEPGIDYGSEIDDDDILNIEENIIENIEDFNVFNKNYDNLKKNNKKIPFILKRFINGKYEYWKLEDLIYWN